ncbi:MAG TPA: MBL fold metallo-hydrolase [Syntrophales bacterium]
MKEKIFWLGHSSIRIEGEQVIYIDPWKIKGEPKADLILVSHSHHDHFSLSDIGKLQKEKTIVVGPPDCTAQIKGDVRTMRPGDTITVGDIKIEAVPSYTPQKPFHPRANQWLGFILDLAGKRLYYAGDTDFIPEMKNIKADIVILPVGGTYTMTAEEAARAVELIQPQLAIPIHCGDIVGKMEDAENFKKLTKVPVEIKDLTK